MLPTTEMLQMVKKRSEGRKQEEQEDLSTARTKRIALFAGDPRHVSFLEDPPSVILQDLLAG